MWLFIGAFDLIERIDRSENFELPSEESDISINWGVSGPIIVNFGTADGA